MECFISNFKWAQIMSQCCENLLNRISRVLALLLNILFIILFYECKMHNVYNTHSEFRNVSHHASG
ncbi:hypothetical protein X975_15912, partial [Stegodyphus mimosarum]